MWERAQGDEARGLRLQYLSIEGELERAYRAVAPCAQNAATFSYTFADIIRSAAGAFEVISKALCARFHELDPMSKLDVYNYLALDRFLDLSAKRVVHLLALDQFPGLPEATCPFGVVAGWDRGSEVGHSHVPQWWRAYTAIKHDLDGLRTSATLVHATAATAALFLLVQSVFGFGVLTGGWFEAPGGTVRGTTKYLTAQRWARLFNMGTS
jgi:hypothetical protein